MSDDYPDHLNPFKRNVLRESFRTIKSTFRKTFRKKTRHLNKSSTSLTTSSTFPQSYDAGPTEAILRDNPPINRNIERAKSHEVFLRSRLNNRAAHAATYSPRTMRTESANPFEDETDENREKDEKDERDANRPNAVEKPPRLRNLNTTTRYNTITGNNTTTGNNRTTTGYNNTTGRRKPKRRAPLPPSMIGSEAPEHHNSKWSISSYETECDFSENIEEEKSPVQEEALQDIQEIRNQIENLCADNVEKSRETIDDGDHKKTDEALIVNNIEKGPESPEVQKDTTEIDDLKIESTEEESTMKNTKLETNLINSKEFKDDQNNNRDASANSLDCDKELSHDDDKEIMYIDKDTKNLATMGSVEELTSSSNSDSEKPTLKVRRNKLTRNELMGDVD